jgi:glycosyltransferase involved in cell wall biosynthesis
MYLLPKKLFKYTLTRWSFNRVTHDVLNNICSDIDIIHAAHIYFDGYAVATYADDTDVPFTVTCHGTILNNYYDASARVQSIVEFVLKRASKIFCVSDALVDIAADLVGEEKVHLVPIGADPNRFPVDSRLQLRSDNGVPSSKPLVLFCGSCSYLKGIDQLIELLPTIE